MRETAYGAGAVLLKTRTIILVTAPQNPLKKILMELPRISRISGFGAFQEKIHQQKGQLIRKMFLVE